MKQCLWRLPKLGDGLADTDATLPGATSLQWAQQKLELVVEVKLTSGLVMKHW